MHICSENDKQKKTIIRREAEIISTPPFFCSVYSLSRTKEQFIQVYELFSVRSKLCFQTNLYIFSFFILQQPKSTLKELYK